MLGRGAHAVSSAAGGEIRRDLRGGAVPRRAPTADGAVVRPLQPRAAAAGASVAYCIMCYHPVVACHSRSSAACAAARSLPLSARRGMPPAASPSTLWAREQVGQAASPTPRFAAAGAAQAGRTPEQAAAELASHSAGRALCSGCSPRGSLLPLTRGLFHAPGAYVACHQPTLSFAPDATEGWQRADTGRAHRTPPRKGEPTERKRSSGLAGHPSPEIVCHAPCVCSASVRAPRRPC